MSTSKSCFCFQAAWLGNFALASHVFQIKLLLPNNENYALRQLVQSLLACLAQCHTPNAGNVAEEEVMYTLFNLALPIATSLMHHPARSLEASTYSSSSL